MMMPVLLCAVALLLAWVVAFGVLRHAARLGLVQAPNERSSHRAPTPAGGGIGIVVGGSVTAAWLAFGGEPRLWGIAALGVVLAAVGLLDDVRHLPARLRFAAQVAVCALLLVLLGDLPPLAGVPGHPVGGWLLAVLLVIAGTWWINLFNFMDGIDGIAGTQAVFMLAAGALLTAGASPAAMAGASWLWMWALVAAIIGFLVLNWPPARIFMGDVGSTYLAFVILALGLLSVQSGATGYVAWIVLGALFVSDATVTLVTRILRGERWHEAHRSHAYQRLARRWGSHRPVTLLATAINVFWLAPLAWACGAWPQAEWGLAALACAPLCFGAVALGAGRVDVDV